MVGRYDVAHCAGDCGACELSCHIADSGSSFTEFLGTWSTTGEGTGTVYVTAGTNAYVYTVATSGDRWRVRVSVQVETPFPGSEHFIVRLLGGIQDSNNHVYIEYEFRNFGPDTEDFFATCQISAQYRMGKVVSGTPTVLTTQPYSFPSATRHPAWNYINSGAEETKTVELELCWDGVVLTGNGTITVVSSTSDGWRHSRNRLMASTDVTPPGNLAAFGTGGTLTNIGDVSFFNFSLDRILDEGLEDCEECPVQCCAGDPTPGAVTVGISGTMADATSGSCVFDCQDLVGTHVLATNSDLGLDFAGDDSCTWILEIEVGATCSGSFAMRTTFITALIDPSLNGLLQVAAFSQVGLGTHVLGTWNTDEIFGCVWDGITLSPTGSGPNTSPHFYKCPIANITISS